MHGYNVPLDYRVTRHIISNPRSSSLPSSLSTYIIRVKRRETYFTAVFALLQQKMQQMYEYLLQTVVNEYNNRKFCLSPTYVKIDFKMAMFKAINNVFGYPVNVRGCLNHLCQSEHRKIQETRLSSLYKQDEIFAHFCRKIDSLAFLP